MMRTLPIGDRDSHGALERFGARKATIEDVQRLEVTGS